MSASLPDQQGPFDGSAPLSLGGDVVAGEGVVLDVRLARLPSRTLALFIDVTLELAVFLVVSTGVAVLFGGAFDSASVAAVNITLLVLVLLVMPATIEILTHGRSVGKIVMGLRIVRDDGGPIRLRHSMVRALFLVFADLWMTLGVVGLFCSLLSVKAKRLGDQFAGTIAIRERLPSAAAPAIGYVPMPAPLAGWAARLDFTGVSDPLMGSARAFLFRAPQLAPETRLSMGSDLAVRLCGQLAVRYPSGAPAEAVVAAVVAERGRRAQLSVPAQRQSPPVLRPPAPITAPGAPAWTIPVRPPDPPPAGDAFVPPG